jgi:YfiH family protein
MEMNKAGKVHYLEPRIFTATGLTLHGFTTRHEGVSRQPYNSLNMGTNTFDSPHNVQGNRSILARAFGARAERLVTVNQVHGLDLLVIDTPNPDYSHFLKLECDGIVTNQPGVMIGVCIADCVPILLLDPQNKVVAALHAGWKGTAGDIASKGVETLVGLFGSKTADILAAVGPAIGPCCYEVDAPVWEAFDRNGVDLDCFERKAGSGKWGLDLATANCRQLLKAGVAQKNIATTPMCVSCEHDLFFSYRRDKGETGRQMGFIMLIR